MPEDRRPLLRVENLSVVFRTSSGTVRAVNGLDYELAAGETLAILGESGSGKSVSAAAVMDILDTPPAEVIGGRVLFDGEDLLALPAARRREMNGPDIAMVFQDALVSLNPVYSIGWQVAEVIAVHRRVSAGEARETAIGLLERVGIPGARERAGAYPHQLSGGQRQRVMIAMAIALEPRVLIADEPTTALDVTIQAQIVDLLSALREETGMGLVLITHDLGLVADVAERVVVMYAGRAVEEAPISVLFTRPAHPYTIGLMRSVPRGRRDRGRLVPVLGAPPDLARIPSGCPFHPRCHLADQRCRTELPERVELEHGHTSACHRAREVHDGAR